MDRDAGELEPRAIESLLEHLDHPVPALSAQDVIARARRPVLRWRPAAAVLLMVGLAGAAYAFPGSPLPRWITAIVDQPGGRSAIQAPSARTAESEAGSGIAVSPGSAYLIHFLRHQSAGEIRVRLVPGDQVTVRSTAGGVTFTSESTRLLIDNPGATGSYQVEIPAGARRVEIRIGALRVFLKQGEQVDAGAARVQDGDYRLPLRESHSVP